MKKPSVAILANPAARTVNRRKIDLLTSFFDTRSRLEGVYLSEDRGDIEKMTAELSREKKAGILVIVGGDGTLNEAVNGISSPGPTIGFIPGGTSNVIRHDLAIPVELEKAAEVALYGNPVKIRPGVANGRKFLLMAGVGIDGEIARTVSSPMKRILGKGEYVRRGIISFVSSPRYFLDVTGEGGTRMGEYAWAVVARSSHYAGRFRVVKEATFTEELLHAYLFRKGGTIRYVSLALKILFSVDFNRSEVRKEGGKSFHIESDREVPYQVDGDYAGMLPLSLSISEKVIKINGKR